METLAARDAGIKLIDLRSRVTNAQESGRVARVERSIIKMCIC